MLKFLDENLDNIKIRLFYNPNFHCDKNATIFLNFSMVFEYKDLLLYYSSGSGLNSLYLIHNEFSNLEHRRKVLTEISKKYITKFKQVFSRIYIIVMTPNGYALQPFEVSKVDKNILENYNEDFLEVDKKIKETLRKKDKGIILLHGKKGTGKSNYIRHLIKNVKKRFIFVPSYINKNISETNFITFLINQCRNSVLILEDVEDLLMSREEKAFNTGIMSDLLNMTDGLMSDTMRLQFICTFNTNLKNIDEALLRPGRLIAEYYFDELSEEKAASIYQRLNKEVGKHRILCDIYNDHEVLHKVEKKENKIGFK